MELNSFWIKVGLATISFVALGAFFTCTKCAGTDARREAVKDVCDQSHKRGDRGFDDCVDNALRACSQVDTAVLAACAKDAGGAR